MQATAPANRPPRFDSDDSRWNAVLNRDTQAEGAFFYGVTSTGIFCRPTCPSRRPARDRVAFFDSAVEAMRGGFRPCKRCQPQSPSIDRKFVQQIVDTIDGWQDGQPSLSDLAEVVGLSPSHVQRKFKQATGISPAEFARQRRIQRFRNELKEGRDVTTSIYEAGFESAASLYGSSDRELGMTPASYRAGGMDYRIHYVTADSPLGRLLLAYTERGVASIQFGENDDELRDALEREFPEAEISRSEDDHPWLQVVLDYLSGEIPHPDLPLDVQGTAFQRRVWQAIRVIPPGETRSYADVAAAIGQPAAVRAVANACANNRAPLIIPCHRVIRSDGSQGGYRFGAERKAALLSHESRA